MAEKIFVQSIAQVQALNIPFWEMFSERERVENLEPKSPIYYLLTAAKICDVFLIDLQSDTVIVRIDNTSQSFESGILDVIRSGWFPEIRRVKAGMDWYGHTLAGAYQRVAFATDASGATVRSLRETFDILVGLRN